MTGERAGESHPRDIELAAWVDEPEAGAAEIPAHLAACAHCRDRVAELKATRAAIALDPPIPSDAEFAAQRERILAAIEEASREGSGRIVRRIGWLVPLAAAAAVAAIVLLGRLDRPAPGTGSAPGELVAEADAAAEQAADLALDTEALDTALTASDPLSSPAIERAVAIEDDFALLSDAEQSAVLRDLERTDFDL